MRLFIKNLIIFLLPLTVFFAPPFVILLWSGEFYPLRAVEWFINQPQTVLIGQAYNNFGSELQIDEVRSREPQVITLGNSHVGQFKSKFFKEDKSFYNTAGAAVPLSDYTYFIEQTAKTPPKIIIANMEHSMFSSEGTKNHVASRPNPFLARSQLYDPFFESFFRNGGWWRVYADYFSGKFTLADIFTPRKNSITAIGLRALVSGGGMTNDGSNYPGDLIHNQFGQDEVLSNIDAIASNITNTNFNQYGGGISNDAIAELRVFLAASKSRGLFIIGFLPPIAHKIYIALKQQYGTTYAFRNLATTLTSVYKEYGFDFYDFSDISSFGSSDYEMIEAQHGGEKMYLRMFIRMAEGSTSLGKLADLPYLKTRLANATSTYYVFGIDGD